MTTQNAEVTAKPAGQSAGQEARLFGSRDARRYAKQIRWEEREKNSTPPATVCCIQPIR